MEKVLRYKVPFQSVGGTDYVLEMYGASVAGAVVETLQGGDTVLTTDEEAGDDLFTSVHGQTGTLSLVDEGQRLLEKLDLKNNTEMVVRLKSGTKVLWQGFMNCETYNQKYVGYRQLIDYSLNSVLTAMGSVDMVLDEDMLFNRVIAHVAWCFKTIDDRIDLGGVMGNMYWPHRYTDILFGKYMYQNTYFSNEECVNGDNIQVEVKSDSCQKFLSDLCQFFGLSVHEDGRNIYFVDPSEYTDEKATQYDYCSFASLYGTITSGEWDTLKDSLNSVYYPLDASLQLSSYGWSSDSHQISVNQGVKRIRLSANLKEFECSIELPETPYGQLQESKELEDFFFDLNGKFYSLMECKYMRHQLKVSHSDAAQHFQVNAPTMLSNIPYAHTTWDGGWGTGVDTMRDEWLALTQGPTYKTGTMYEYCGAMFYCWEQDDQFTKGLLLYGLPQYVRNSESSGYWSYSRYTQTEEDHIYMQQTGLPFAAADGYLHIDASAEPYRVNGRKGISNGTKFLIETMVKWGNLYWNGSVWQSSFCVFDLLFNPDGTLYSNYDESLETQVKDGYFIPVSYFNVGFVTIKFFPFIGGYGIDDNDVFQVCDLLMKSMNLEYLATNKVERSDRSSNEYMIDCGDGFSDEKSVELPVATDASNDIKANMLWNNPYTMTQLVKLDGKNLPVRLEVDLLKRMKRYYIDSRRKLELDVKPKSVTDSIYLHSFDGFDNRYYLPVGVNRDWAADTENVTLIEIPE